jgi:hypothetical protein
MKFGAWTKLAEWELDLALTSFSETVTCWIRLYSIHKTTRVNLGVAVNRSVGSIVTCCGGKTWSVGRFSAVPLCAFDHFTFLTNISVENKMFNVSVRRYWGMPFFRKLGDQEIKLNILQTWYRRALAEAWLCKANIRACIQCYQVAKTHIFSACDFNLKSMPNILLYLKL